MLIGGILLGLLLGLAAGGSLLNLSTVRLRWVGLLLTAVIVRFGTEAALSRDIPIAETLRVPLFAIAFGLLLIGLWANRRNPGLGLAFVGILLNAIAIGANGGFMPVWIPSLQAAGFSVEDITSPFHVPVGPELDLEFLLQAGPLGDILPIPLPFIQNVASVGDLFLTIGLGFFLFASVVRAPSEPDVGLEPQWPEGGLDGLAARTSLTRAERAAFLQRRIRPGTGLAPGLREAAALDRPQLGGASAPGLNAPSSSAAASVALAPLLPADVDGGLAGAGALERPAVPGEVAAGRVRQHPYVRLALNGSFSALWAGQLISLFGDRVHTIALSVLVFNATGSYLAVAGVFFAATLPNLLLSPIAGTFVDRWDQRDVMVVSDLLRAAVVLMVPIAAVTSIVLVYPLLFLLTSISVFFRPARVAVLPRIVRDDELLPANSAMWVGETLADVIGYPLAGVFVAFLANALPLAFWLDSATYAASAALILTVVVPPLVRDPRVTEQPTVRADLQAGYRFLRGQPTLFANTIQAAIAQFTVGVLTALTFSYAATVVATPAVDAGAAFAFLETAIGVGNLVGGFFIGLFGAQMAKGRMVIAGYTIWGACVVGLALTGHLGLAVGLMLGSGVANMIFVIPSQTLFQELTPPDMIGRVVGFRFALVFGMTTFAMGIGGIFAELLGIPVVLAISGLVTMAAGLGGLLVPALRDA